jgi:hypothetical protein
MASPFKMTAPLLGAFKALSTPPTQLTEIDAHLLCKPYVEGSCKSTSCKPEHHRLCRIQGTSASPTEVALESPNVLSASSSTSKKVFEDDGPGHLSKSGPRHDNDNVEIAAIRVLPTTDEVSNFTS